MASQFANARLIYGDLDDGDTLGGEAMKADIVLSASAYQTSIDWCSKRDMSQRPGMST